VRFLISRTDKIGDVVLTLPIAGWLKEKYPGCSVYFLGRTYTKSVIEASQNIDGFLNWDELSKSKQALSTVKSYDFDTVFHVFPSKEIAFLCKEAGISRRIGTSHRWYHWLTCTKKVHFSRKKSSLHESQLNFRLLGLEEPQLPQLADLPRFYGMKPKATLAPQLQRLLNPDKLNIILHPKSKGSAREWSLENFKTLIKLSEGRFQFFITGGPDEAEELREWSRDLNDVFFLAGTLRLEDFIPFIGACDGLIAASTGPLHLAASLGIHALGIFPPIKPMDPSRWAPIGEKASFQVAAKSCSDCLRRTSCACMDLVTPVSVYEALLHWKKTDR
jgi:ADP-heptose:LPS heptosyltransferase